MKKILTLVFFLTSIALFSQSIVVDTNSHTVQELVNNVLINATCVTASNISSRTGTNFGSTNGIGYFTNSNPNFPMQSGVILSTGNVLNSAGPNTSVLSSGNAAWTGDYELEATLLPSGISMNSSNATVLEFDFTPISSNFDFDFLFASEEYGNYQCQFSDAFAFILTNTATGVSTNLAVVPGTSDPISVITIRDFLYNSTCPSVNQQYFGSFNGGSNSANSATNFNGQTVVMNASAVLTPNTTYHIKLVIADRGDYQSDSAIFLSSGSFNIGQQVLGQDLTVSSNTAICQVQTTNLNTGLSAANYTFKWKKDGVVLAGEVNPTLVVSQPGTYEVTYTNIIMTCQVVTDSIIVEYFPIFSTNDPKNLFKCDTSQASYMYNLAQNTTLINSGASPSYSISYFSNAADANNDTNAISTNYSSSGNQTIYVRIVNPLTVCYIVKSFQLLLTSPAFATQPNDLITCSTTSGSTTALFDLSSLNSEVLNGLSPTLYSVSYYASQADANSGNNPLPLVYNSLNTTIYPRVILNDDAACFSTTTANLIVSPKPAVDGLQQVVTCDSYTLQPLTNGNYFSQTNGGGTPYFAGDVITNTMTLYIFNQNTTAPFCGNESIFDIIIIKPSDIVDYTNTYCDNFVIPGNPYGGGYFTQPNGGGTNLTSGTILTTSQTIWFYFQSTIAPFCIIDSPSDITIIQTQQVTTFPNGFDCTSFVLQPLSFGNYFTQPNGGGTQLSAGDALTSSQAIYVYGTTGICPSQSIFDVVIGLQFPTSQTVCASYTLPHLIVGNYYTQPLGGGTQLPEGTIITTDTTIYVYAVSQSQPNCTDNYSFTIDVVLPPIQVPNITSSCVSYVLPSIPVGNYFTGSAGTGTQLNVGDILTTSQTVYIYLNDNNGCSNDVAFDVTVYPKPIIDSRANIDTCDSYTLTNLVNGNYFTGPNGTGTMYNGGDVLTTSQTIYIYAVENGCSAETSFDLTIFSISAQQLPNVTRCDNYVLPALNANNKYYTQPYGQFGSGVEIPAGTVITTSQTLYIYVESGGRINCTGESSFNIIIVTTPIANPVPASLTTVCDQDGNNDGSTSFDLQTLSATVLGTQSASDYSVTYFSTIADANSKTNSILNTTSSLVYVRISSTLASICYDVKPISIIVNKLPKSSAKDGIICIDNVTGAVVNPYTIESGLSATTHSIQWFDSTGTVVSTNANYTTQIPGVYSIIASNNATGCASEELFITVTTSQPAIVSYTLSEDFSNNQTVVVQAIGAGGDYEYQLDNGSFQDSPIFENVTSGSHTITVHDKNNCGTTYTEAMIVNYPHFFTPNGDGINDYWNIYDLKDQPNAEIFIYDRYGKFITEIKTNSVGWDGKIKSEMALSDDYWFTVSYLKNNQKKEFKAHFAMKR